MSFYRPEWGSDGTNFNFFPKQKSRWLFQIQNITTGNVGSAPLPCVKASRPKLNFREMQAEHLNETISFPSKPEWQPIQLLIYDRCIPYEHPVMTWLKQQYNPKNFSAWYPCIDPLSYKTCATLILLDGCGGKLEEWCIEHCYPQSVDFGELDMQSMDIVTADVVLKYDRAYQTYPATPHELYTPSCTPCISWTDPTCDQGTTGGGSGGVVVPPSSQNPGSQNGPLNGPPATGFAPRMPDFIMI
jgi:hypothetical protein